MFSRFFISRPIFATVLSVVVVILGLVAYTRLPVEEYPELAPPIVRVEARYPGADAATIAATVAAPIEQEVNGVDRMIYMTSTSSNGVYSLDISFEQGVDIDMAAVLVQNRLSVAEPRLPEEVRRQGVTARKQSTSFVGVFAIYSPDGRYDDIFLSNYMTINMRDEVSRIYGVGGTNVLPAKEYGMRIWLDLGRMEARGITVADVNAAIREQNVQVAAGVVGRPPTPTGTDFELVVNTKGRLSDPEEFADIIIKSEGAGRVVRVRDVARVELGARDYSTLTRFNGMPAAIMPAYQLPGANLVDVATRLEATFERLKEDFPEGLKGTFFYDASMFIRASVHEVMKTLVEAFLLVSAVVLIFLQSWRTTLIPIITIPVSLIGTFIAMAAFGFSINMLTMFGLVLAVGIVVDDAIVVVENVERNLAEGIPSPADATARAMQQIFGAIIAITLVLMSVFLPSAALPGITGEMFRQFALTIAASTAFSALNALTLTPALCALLLRPHDHAASPGPIRRLVGAPARAFNRAFDALTRVYAAAVRRLLRLWPLTLAMFAAVLTVTFLGYVRVPTGFVPNEDLGFVVVAAQLPDGASLERSYAVIERARKEISQVEGVANVVSLAGFSILDGQGPSYANAWIVLDSWDKRTKAGRSIAAVTTDIQARLAPFQEARFIVFSLPAIRGLGNTSGFDLRVLDRQNLGQQAIFDATNALTAAASGQSKIGIAYSTFRPGVPQVYLDIDRERAIKMDVPLSLVFETLQTALGSAYVNDFNRFGRTFQVNTQAEAEFRRTAEDILRLQVRNRAGEMVPMGSLVTISDRMGADRITRYNMYPASTVNGSAAPGASSGEAIELMEQVAAAALPPGMGYEWSGMSYQEKQAQGQGTIAFGLDLLLVYLILAAQYESWLAPFSVALSIPLVLCGSVLALMAAGLDNNIFTQIGLVLLIGLGAKNAILIVEFARANRAAGHAIIDSAVEAARTRFRPILMTSLAFILGVVPLIDAEGAGAASRRALGTAVFGGMIGVTVLGLIFTPTLFMVVQWVEERVTRKRVAPPADQPTTA